MRKNMLPKRFNHTMIYVYQLNLSAFLLIFFAQLTLSSTVYAEIGDFHLSFKGSDNISGNSIDTIVAPAISGRIWRDLNQDGIQNANEPGIKAFAVQLTGISSEGNSVLREAHSGDDGIYLFEGLTPGTYTIEFIEPPTFNTTIRHAGNNTAIDSDGPFSDPIVLMEGMIESTIDCGFFVQAPTDFEDDDFPYCHMAAQSVFCNMFDLNEFGVVMYPMFVNYGPMCGTPLSSYQNPSWLAFMASESTVSLIIHATNCVVPIAEIGVQYAIYTDCSEDEWVICAAMPCSQPGDIYASANNFKPGHVYYLVIDGCNATQCTYWIEFLEGVGQELADPTGISNPVSVDNKICTNMSVPFHLDNCDHAAEYLWTINGVKTDLSTAQTISLTFDIPGIYELCGQGITACDSSALECILIEVHKELEINLESTTICTGTPVNILLQSFIVLDNEIEVWFDPNPLVSGMKNYLFTDGEGIILDTLALSDDICEPVEVMYLVKLAGEQLICEGKTDTIRLLVGPLPVIIEDTEQVCMNDLPKEIAIRLSCEQTDDFSFEWTHEAGGPSGNGQHIVLSDTSGTGLHPFSVIAHTPWGCTNSGFFNVIIHKVDTTVIKDDQTLMASENEGDYQWLNCYAGLDKIIGATNQSFTPLNSGSYAVEITKDGCVDTSHCHRLILSDVLENTIGQGLKVFPNPTDGTISIELPEVFSFIEVKVSSIEGKEMAKKSFINAQTLQMSLQDYQQGMYFLNIQAGEKHAMVKVFRL